MRFFFVPLILIGWPLAEIAGFVLVGRAVGLWATLGLVIGTAVLGALLLRRQGTHLLQKISSESREGRVPGRALIDGAMIVVAGILLLLPGFLTDILGIALFIPFVRSFIWTRIGRRVVVVRSPGSNSYRYQSGPSQDGPYQSGKPAPGGKSVGPVVDLDEEDFRRDPDPSSPNTPSPWAGPKSGDR